MFKSRSSLLGLLLVPLGLLYMWLAYMATQSMFASGDIFAYVILLFFVVLGLMAVAGGINLIRGSRR